MAIRLFVEASNKPPKVKHRGKDRIPGTNKVRTYVSNHGVYSSQSNLENLIKHRRQKRT